MDQRARLEELRARQAGGSQAQAAPPSQGNARARLEELRARQGQAPEQNTQLVNQSTPQKDNFHLGHAALLGANGITLGLGDEVGAGVHGGISALASIPRAIRERSFDPIKNNAAKTFKAKHDGFNDFIDEARESKPLTSVALETLPSFLTGGAALKGAKTLGGKALQGGATSAATGGVFSFGDSRGNLEQRGKAAKQTAKVAGGLGAAIPFLGAPIARGGAAVRQRIGEVLKTNVGPAENQAVARVLKAQRQSGLSEEDVAKRIEELGPEAFLADTLGLPGQDLARSATNVNSEARQLLEDAVTARGAGQGERLTESLLSATKLNEPRTLNELQETARQELSPAIKEAYDAARAQGDDIDLGQFTDIFNTTLGRQARGEGERLARDRVVAEATQNGQIIGNPQASNLDIINEAKKSLDARAAPALGQRQTNEQAIAGQLARSLRERADRSVSEFGEARALSQKLRQREEAIKLGFDAGNPRVGADFDRVVARLPEEQLGDVAQGFASKKIDQINSRRDTPGLVDSVFGSRRQKDALATALGNNAGGVQRQIDAERAFAATTRGLQGNSTTARQLNQLAQAGAIPAAGAVTGFATGGDAQSGAGGALAALAVRRGGGAAINAVKRKNEAKISKEIADLLLKRELPKAAARASKKPQSKTDSLDALQSISNRTGIPVAVLQSRILQEN